MTEIIKEEYTLPKISDLKLFDEGKVLKTTKDEPKIDFETVICDDSAPFISCKRSLPPERDPLVSISNDISFKTKEDYYQQILINNIRKARYDEVDEIEHKEEAIKEIDDDRKSLDIDSYAHPENKNQNRLEMMRLKLKKKLIDKGVKEI